MWLARELLPEAPADGSTFLLLRHLRELVTGGEMPSEIPEAALEAESEREVAAGRSLAASMSRDEREAVLAASVRLKSPAERERVLYQFLLDGYNFEVPPTNASAALSINFLKVMDLDLKTSTLTMPAWVRLLWQDDRLKFNRSLWNLPSIAIQADQGTLENTRIWVPDIELYNSRGGMAGELTVKAAVVSPSGDVFWSRPGVLNILCKFSGLEQFPGDTLTCSLEFGSWNFDGATLDLQFRSVDGGYMFPTKENAQTAFTAGSTYQTFTIQDICARRLVTTYDCCDGEWPLLIYVMKLKRSSSFYVMKLILPQFTMACLSIITYFMKPDIGERLGFGITLVLAVVATDIVATEYLPVCQEVLLMNWISWTSLFFCVISLFESGVVLHLHNLEATDSRALLPWCLRGLKICGVRCKPPMLLIKLYTRFRRRSKARNRVESDLSVTGVVPESGLAGILDYGEKADDGRDEPESPTKMHIAEKQRRPAAAPTEEERVHLKTAARMRMQLYREAFYVLDQDFSGLLERDEIDYFGHFMMGDDWNDAMLDEFMEKADTDGSGGLGFAEFTAFCESCILDHEACKEFQYVSEMVKGFISMTETHREMVRARWRVRGDFIDTTFRWLVPSSVFLAYFWQFWYYTDYLHSQMSEDWCALV
eukprot:TRINITY_DN17751_c0_g1_i1.p1 TRINITY_DN17751_c0_g1~~TRINITY_DN17751_c0_g1_i1.p1  ORF type:complete len:753 (-),score=110.33 TRINITY_DN17751_c0_g1_i1:112-2070(-)